MNRRLFTVGGYRWSAIPPLEILPRGPARDVLSYLVDSVHDDGQAIEHWNREIGRALGRSIRWVQYALADLIGRGYLAREYIHEVLPDGRTLWKRVLKMVQRPAGKKEKPKEPSAKSLRKPKISPPHANACGETMQPAACSPSFEGNQKEEFKAVDVGDGTPSTAGEEEELAELLDLAQDPSPVGRNARMELRRRVDAGELPAEAVPPELISGSVAPIAAPKAPTPAQDAPPAAAPGDPPSAPVERTVAETAIARMRDLERRVAHGDRVLIPELEQMRRSLANAGLLPQQPPEAPGVASPGDDDGGG